ncbi:50S ribosomal protein L10 [Halodesulfurarchaeum sp. HSR-GB]|uniref:50S ribosomal protein L10 n=1 Tax=Halodesulfurarchaeum sp. HSR-GB TaxID=3074077 RepID=UPI002862FA32|nr:50S ribosomal protein L10 [Halodesulfurarchaeum sp. HSR-GB]MDR5657157.1 50S ribosomal protein L10 [Halodesulfurarchaeum sp. HSR-GB]
MTAEAEHTTEHVPEWKQQEVEDLVSVIESYDSVGIVDVQGIPSRQLQEMRADLYGSATLRMSRNTLLERALEQVDEGLEDLVPFLSGHVGLVGTNDNPFALYRRLEQSKTAAPISAGETAPNDIVIEEGDTGMDPGPFVGDLQNVGAAARIDEGSIKVLEDSVVAEAGDVVSQDLAGVLGELGIEPKEVGIDLRAVFADGVLFEAEELEIDVEEYRADFQAAAAAGRNLAVNAAIPTTESMPALLAKAEGEAKSLGLQASIESPDLMDDLVSTADAQVKALAAQIEDDEALPEELRDLEAPGGAKTTDTEESTDDQPEADAEPEDAEDDDDDEDEDAGGEGLGAMFG